MATASSPIPIDMLTRIRAPSKRQVHTRSALTVAVLLLCDLAALVVAMGSVILTRWYFGGEFQLIEYVRLWPVLALFILGYAWAGLYPGIPYGPVQELRRVCYVTISVYLLLGSITFLLNPAPNTSAAPATDPVSYSRLIFLFAAALSVVAVLAGRAIMRATFAHRQWWGHSVVVLGGGRTARSVVKLLKRQPSIGLKPIAILEPPPSLSTPNPSDSADNEKNRVHFAGIPRIHQATTENAVSLAEKYPHLFFLVVIAVMPRRQLLDLLDEHQHLFRHLIVLPDFHGISSLGVVAHDFQGTLGIQVQQRLLDWRRRALKRVLDIAFVLALTPVVLPVMAVIAAIVALQTRGKIFFGQERIGMNGKRFKVWKFRTMVPNADKLLDQYLETHPDMKREWKWTGKVRKDPRVLPIGRWLRRLSLDELPQIYNVLIGDMSVVGPRPIVQHELPRYGRNLNLYHHVRPGLTGLWQVTGRNNNAYHDRVRLDVYYVRNWSIWLDLYILAKTPFVVASGRGAY